MYRELKESLKNKTTCILLTVIEASPSSNRNPGTQMVVTLKDSFGSIGGGNLETTIIQVAREIIEKDLNSSIKDFILSNEKEHEEVLDLDTPCTGQIRVLFEKLEPTVENIAFAKQMTEILHSGINSYLVINLTDFNNIVNEIVLKSELKLPKKAKLVKDSGNRFFIIPLDISGKVYIFGAGHISVSLVPILSDLDFNCTVIDDSPEFANLNRFPKAKNIYVTPFESIGKLIKLSKDDYAIIVTRGFENNFLVEKQILKQDPYYVGMLASPRMVKDINKKMLKEGYTHVELARVSSPIGLDIKAQTPMEIAVSIAAELIKKRAERNNL